MTRSATPKSEAAQGAVAGSVAGATFRFQTDSPGLLTYARTHLANLIGAPAAAVNIDATLRWHEEQPPRDRVTMFPHLAGMERVDRDLYVGPGHVHWFRID